jgi:GAF domain-containing protein
MTNLTELHEDLARVAATGGDLDAVLGEITRTAGRAIPAIDAASITLIRGEKAFTAAYDGQMALDADELQYERGYGPCIDAGLGGQVMMIDDLATEERWADYCRAVAGRGIGSSLSMPLPYQTVSVGALNCYSRRTRAFGEDDRALAEEVAAWIALAVGHADTDARTMDELSNLKIAMRTRAVIDQAKGILVERFKITEDMAFTVLSRASQNSNIKLSDIAEQLVTTGLLRGQPTEPPRGAWGA